MQPTTFVCLFDPMFVAKRNNGLFLLPFVQTNKTMGKFI